MKEMQTTHTFQTRRLGSALEIWPDKKGSFEVRRQTPEHVVVIDSTPQQSQEDKKKNKTPLTDRSARVWVPIIVKIEPRNDCTRGLLHSDRTISCNNTRLLELKIPKMPHLFAFTFFIRPPRICLYVCSPHYQNVCS
jgi:hypothetical protein